MFFRCVYVCLNNQDFKKACLIPIDRTATHLNPPMQLFLCRIALDELEVGAWDFRVYLSSTSSGSSCEFMKACTHSPCVPQSEGTCTTQGMLCRRVVDPVKQTQQGSEEWKEAQMCSTCALSVQSCPALTALQINCGDMYCQNWEGVKQFLAYKSYHREERMNCSPCLW